MLKTRIFTAAILISILILLVHLGGWYFRLFVIFGSLMCTVEFCNICGITKRKSFYKLILLLCLIIIIGILKLNSIEHMVILLCIILISILIAGLFNPQPLDQIIQYIGLGVMAIIWTAVLPLSLIIIREKIPQGEYWIYFMFMLTGSNDSGALFAGKFYGKRPLYKIISPKKTIEGFMGGFAASTLAAIIAKILFFNELTFWQGFGAVIIASTFGPMGDLCESMLKRSYKVKDSGTILPGHGGFLDRTDSILFVAPIVYCWLILLNI